MIVDTSVLVTHFNRNDPGRDRVKSIFESSDEPLVVSPYVVAEVDYMLATRCGVRAELEALRALTSGACELATFDDEEIAVAIDVVERYAEHNIGIADASNVVLADRYDTKTIATLDRRHFEMMRPLSGGWFTIIPAV